MNIDLPTVDTLRKHRIVLAEQINSAVEAYLDNPDITAYPIATGYSIDLKAAVRNHEWIWKIARDPAASARLKRGTIWTAILLARVQKA
ncbi:MULTISPECIES: hypothetical protein [Methylorubrum]|uniref:hypothetical protein n=1 Tax=Methylorubrum TaxID=2282523 RepID=UPI00209F1D39|nr:MULTISPECIES: hypothetical protein [Methylorubrum]MCP1550741.1 diacylglycerol kinase [Methylorubrum zatmanii]MCP1552646.1 diacylglycerol kinase [Methylorubrum extorquens]MCP1581044.1 diacylglycerol kinase [Methylorubrum extorquens]